MHHMMAAMAVKIATIRFRCQSLMTPHVLNSMDTSAKKHHVENINIDFV